MTLQRRMTVTIEGERERDRASKGLGGPWKELGEARRWVGWATELAWKGLGAAGRAFELAGRVLEPSGWTSQPAKRA